MLSPTRLVERLYFSYILFFVLLLSVGWTMLPPSHNLALQLGMWLTGLMVSLYALKRSITSIAVIVFVYQAFFISVNSWINLAEYGDILGFNPQDADFYRFCGEAYGDKSFTIFILWLSDIFPTVDDWGFPSLMWLTYKLFGHSAAPWAIRLLNAAVIAWGSERLYRISCGFLEKQESKVVALLWGLMPFATHTAAYGTKENFFVFVVISFFYFLHRNADRGSVWSVSRMLLHCGLLFLFRLANGYAAVLCIVAMYFLKIRGVQRNFAFVFAAVVGAAVALFPIALNVIIQQRGYDSDFFGARNVAKAESVGGAIGFIVNALSSFIGPIPSFISSDPDKLQFLTKYSFTPFVKMIASFHFYYAFVEIIRNKRFKMMPMELFSAINILLLIVAFFGLHVRMHWPHVPLFLIIAYWGYKKYAEKSHAVFWYPIYVGFVLLLVVFYNFR